VAADDGVEARRSPHMAAVAWLQTFRRRWGCGVRLPLDRSGTAVLWRSRVEDGGASLLCTDQRWQRDGVGGDGVASGRSQVEDGSVNLLCMNWGRRCDGGRCTA
jgi:hypothetical protein